MGKATEGLKSPPREAIGRIRFESERRLFNTLSADPFVAPIAKKLRTSNEEDANLRRLLASSLRITDRIIPSLIDRIALVKQITHMEGTQVEAFIHNSAQDSASCMCFENGDVFLLISSGLYKKLTEQELLFVIGHEFGHVVYQHHQLPARALLAQKDKCDADRALQLMAWSRRAEISADRVGLLCCQDFDAAATTLIKLSCGLNEELVDFDLQGYVSQVLDLEAVSRTVHAVEDFYATHPFNPVRVVALNRFWQSQTLCDLLGHAAAKYSDQAVDSRIQEVLQFMDPDGAALQKGVVVECLVWGGLWVAASDGRIDGVEICAVAKSVNSRIANEAVTAMQKAADPLKFIRENFQKAAENCRSLPVPQRNAIVQQLIAVAKANLDVSGVERRTLQEICVALELSPVFPEKILAQYADCVFADLD